MQKHSYFISYDLPEFTVLNEEKANIELDLPSDVDKVIGLRIESNSPDLAYFRMRARILISKKEIYPDGFPVQSLMYGIESPIKFTQVGEIQNVTNKIDIKMKDVDTGFAVFGPYAPRLIVQYTRKGE